MLETRFELDEEKIKREGIYDLEEVYKTIDKMAQASNLIKVSDGFYIAKDSKEALSDLGIFTHCNLRYYEYFTKNVKTWEFVEDDYVVDLIARNKERGKGVWEQI